MAPIDMQAKIVYTLGKGGDMDGPKIYLAECFDLPTF